MGQQVTRDGKIIEQQPDGRWKVVGRVSGQQSAPQPIVIGTPNTRKTRADDIDYDRDTFDYSRDVATAPYDQRKVEADARKAEADAAKAEGDLKAGASSGKVGKEQGDAAGFWGRAVSADSKYSALNYIPSLSGNAKEGLPGGNYLIDGVRQQARQAEESFVEAVMRKDSGAAIQPYEMQAGRVRFFPQPGDGPEVIAQKRQARLAAVAGIAASGGPAIDNLINRAPEVFSGIGLGKYGVSGPLGDPLEEVIQVDPTLVDDRRGEIPGANMGGGQIVTPEAPTYGYGGGEAPRALSQDYYKTIDDPALAGVNRRVDQMLGNGASDGEILSYLDSVGINRGNSTINNALMWRRENPGYKQGAPGYKGWQVNLDDKQVPLTFKEIFDNSVAQSPVGAFGISAGNAATLGALPYFTSDPEQAKAGISEIGRRNPVSSTAGTLVGGTSAILAGEAGLARMGLSRGTAGVAAELGYGGGSGAINAPEGQALQGAIKGLVASGLGGMTGRGTAKYAGDMISPSGGSLAPLYEAGVRPTIGQRLSAAGSDMPAGRGLFGSAGRMKAAVKQGLGKSFNVAEQAMQSVPLTGGFPALARHRAREQFQLGAYNRTLGKIGDELPAGMKPGRDPYNYTADAFGRGYDEVLPQMAVRPDQDFATDLGNWQRNWANGRLNGDDERRLSQIIESRFGSRMKKGGNELVGDNYKKSVSEMRGIARNDRALSEPIKEFNAIVSDAARRHSPVEAVAKLDGLDRAYGGFKAIEKAAKYAGGDTATFTPKQFDRALASNSGRSSAYLRGQDDIYNYAEAGRFLDDTLPNSGTADRFLIGQGVGSPLMGGAYFMNPPAAMAAGTAPLLYAPGLSNMVNAVAAPRQSQALRNAGDLLRRNRRYGGLFGSTAAVPLLTAPE